jgi:hypothetical protein
MQSLLPPSAPSAPHDPSSPTGRCRRSPDALPRQSLAARGREYSVDPPAQMHRRPSRTALRRPRSHNTAAASLRTAARAQTLSKHCSVSRSLLSLLRTGIQRWMLDFFAKTHFLLKWIYYTGTVVINTPKCSVWWEISSHRPMSSNISYGSSRAWSFGMIPKREEPGKRGRYPCVCLLPCVKVPGSSRVPAPTWVGSRSTP